MEFGFIQIQCTFKYLNYPVYSTLILTNIPLTFFFLVFGFPGVPDAKAQWSLAKAKALRI